MLWIAMRVIARSNLIAFATLHPDAGPALRRWEAVIRAAKWQSLSEATRSFSGCKVLNANRARFEIAGGNYRLIAAFDLVRGIAFVKFLGTHADYDRVDALTISQF
jgi:mRNA interferase HigB